MKSSSKKQIDQFRVTLPPPDPERVRALARLLVEAAVEAVLSRVDSLNSDAAGVEAPTASEEMVL